MGNSLTMVTKKCYTLTFCSCMFLKNSIIIDLAKFTKSLSKYTNCAQLSPLSSLTLSRLSDL